MDLKHPLRLIFVGLLTISFLIIILFIFFNIYGKDRRFPNYITGCNFISEELRFSCYRSGIEKFYRNQPLNFVKEIRENPPEAFGNENAGYAIFGTNSHTFYHAAGDFIAENTSLTDIPTILKFCPTTSTSGCMMGLYKRLALKNNYSTDLLSDFYNYCREEEKDHCSHEIGHILHDKYTYSILKILDGISNDKYGIKPRANYNYTTLETSSLSAPFEECRAIIPEEDKGSRDRCYTGVGHNLFIFSEFSPDGYKSIFEDCDKIKQSEKDNCFAFLIFRIGINEAAPRFLSSQFEEGNRVCEDAIKIAKREDLGFHCFTGLGGGIGLYIDSVYGNKEINQDNISFVKQGLLRLAKLCDKAKDNFSDNCYAGLLGTKFKKLYFDLDMYDKTIEKILPKLDKDFVVVG